LSELPGRRHFWTTTLAVAAALFLLTELPYASGRAASPPEHRFLGMLRNVDDLNMYFSFIRQAAEGHVLFEDRLTHLPHARGLARLHLRIDLHRLDPRRCIYVGNGPQDPGFARRLGFEYRDAGEFFDQIRS